MHNTNYGQKIFNKPWLRQEQTVDPMLSHKHPQPEISAQQLKPNKKRQIYGTLIPPVPRELNHDSSEYFKSNNGHTLPMGDLLLTPFNIRSDKPSAKEGSHPHNSAQ
ncbi:hypothetical protein [Pseudomonas sp. GWSMS-1]|uniref:hypothetical protein n=1 Tax=Pseudomonas sp. GWSMS-1 TaxID=3308997 RepID=UPI003CEC7464